ncbi:M48 family metallopeptidase [Planctomycetes bacterium TBK1r]|uniref:SprT-like family protein n=1 Tax=Stieleria magnilauensis TaxID=2527963 RepID=A0ABX5XU78_9BACT|nr:SprT-like family protein [Planctomycetes bacterium TBK1r]
MQQINLGEFDADVIFKDIKNVHLSVYPPEGRVRVSAPTRMDLDTIRVFAISRLPWIKQQRQKFRDQARETPREYLDRESHYVWGTRYLLTCIDADGPPRVELAGSKLKLFARSDCDEEERQEILATWYRGQVREASAPLIAKWEQTLGVQVEKLFVRKMKTRWGSCNSQRQTIRLNTELAKKPVECLEYIVLHELLHLIEPTHNAKFQLLMKQHMPNWELRRDALNRLPVRHEHWSY